MTQSAPPFTLVGFDHVVFVVDDLARARAFYQTVLGCVPGYSYPALGMEQLWCGARLIVLWDITHPGAAGAVPPVRGGRNVDHLRIATGPMDPAAMRAHLAAHAIPIECEAAHGGARGMGHSFYFRDPFGNLLGSGPITNTLPARKSRDDQRFATRRTGWPPRARGARR